MAEKAAIFRETFQNIRESQIDAPGSGIIDVHVIRPGWGSSGYYAEDVLIRACKDRALEAGTPTLPRNAAPGERFVYPYGMHMHQDHPTAQQEREQPARSMETFVGVFLENGRYDENGWDGPGVYAKAMIFPDWLPRIMEKLPFSGISHYVSGIAENGVAPDGKKGPIIKELLPDPLNTVDFVTVPGAGGHAKAIAEAAKYIRNHAVSPEMKVGRQDPTGDTNNQKRITMAEGDNPLTLAEVKTNHPGIYAAINEEIENSLDLKKLQESQKKQLEGAQARADDLEKQLKEARIKIAEDAARTYALTEIGKAKIPEAIGKTLAESLAKKAPLAEDGSLDTVKFGIMVTEAIAEKKNEIEAILKEAGKSGLHDNGTDPGSASATDITKAREDLRDSYILAGRTREDANRLAGIKEV